MSRTPVAVLAGIIFVLLYIAVVVILADRLDLTSLAAPIYWCVAGLVWVLPIRWLMLWAVHKR
jgi:hypothetical protein